MHYIHWRLFIKAIKAYCTLFTFRWKWWLVEYECQYNTEEILFFSLIFQLWKGCSHYPISNTPTTPKDITDTRLHSKLEAKRNRKIYMYDVLMYYNLSLVVLFLQHSPVINKWVGIRPHRTSLRLETEVLKLGKHTLQVDSVRFIPLYVLFISELPPTTSRLLKNLFFVGHSTLI